MNIGIFTGTFDPFTIGHASIVRRTLPLFDKLVIGVAESKAKNTKYSIQERVENIKRIYKNEEKIRIEAYSDLTIDLAKRNKAHFIVRGVRSVKDFEYEQIQADINKQLSGVETILIFAEPQLASISSSVVRELAAFGKDVTDFLPEQQ